MYRAAYLWFYVPSGYMPDDDVRHVFLQDTIELEVERIVEWRMNMGRYELYVKWLGFEED